jgi:hypothetical protein
VGHTVAQVGFEYISSVIHVHHCDSFSVCLRVLGVCLYVHYFCLY